MKKRPPRVVRDLAAFTLATLASCAGSSSYMVELATPSGLAAPVDKAKIVFIRPVKTGFLSNLVVIDGKGAFVGDVPAHGHTMHLVDGGSHQFSLWSPWLSSSTVTIKVRVEPGKTYFATVGSNPWGPKMPNLQPIKRDTRYWDRVFEWVKVTAEWKLDSKGAASWKKGYAANAPEELEHAARAWERYDAEERAKMSLDPDDGRVIKD